MPKGRKIMIRHIVMFKFKEEAEEKAEEETGKEKKEEAKDLFEYVS